VGHLLDNADNGHLTYKVASGHLRYDLALSEASISSPSGRWYKEAESQKDSTIQYPDVSELWPSPVWDDFLADAWGATGAIPSAAYNRARHYTWTVYPGIKWYRTIVFNGSNCSRWDTSAYTGKTLYRIAFNVRYYIAEGPSSEFRVGFHADNETTPTNDIDWIESATYVGVTATGWAIYELNVPIVLANSLWLTGYFTDWTPPTLHHPDPPPLEDLENFFTAATSLAGDGPITLYYT